MFRLFSPGEYTVLVELLHSNMMVRIIPSLIMYFHVHHWFHCHILVIPFQTVMLILHSPKTILHGYRQVIFSITYSKEAIIRCLILMRQISVYHLVIMCIITHMVSLYHLKYKKHHLQSGKNLDKIMAVWSPIHCLLVTSIDAISSPFKRIVLQQHLASKISLNFPNELLDAVWMIGVMSIYFIIGYHITINDAEKRLYIIILSVYHPL